MAFFYVPRVKALEPDCLVWTGPSIDCLTLPRYLTPLVLPVIIYSVYHRGTSWRVSELPQVMCSEFRLWMYSSVMVVGRGRISDTRQTAPQKWGVPRALNSTHSTTFIGTREKQKCGRKKARKELWEDLPPFLPTVRKHLQKARKNDALLWGVAWMKLNSRKRMWVPWHTLLKLQKEKSRSHH